MTKKTKATTQNKKQPAKAKTKGAKEKASSLIEYLDKEHLNEKKS